MARACRVPTARGSPRRARVLARLRRARRPAGEELDDILPTLPAPQRRSLEVALLLSEHEGPAPDRRAVAVGVLGALRALGASDRWCSHRRPALARRLPRPARSSSRFRRLRDEPIACSPRTVPRTPGTGSVPGLRRCSVQRVEVKPMSLGAIGGCFGTVSTWPSGPCSAASTRPRSATHCSRSRSPARCNRDTRAHVRGAAPHPGETWRRCFRDACPAPAGCDTFGAADLLGGVASHGRARPRSVAINGRSARTGRGGRDRAVDGVGSPSRIRSLALASTERLDRERRAAHRRLARSSPTSRSVRATLRSPRRGRTESWPTLLDRAARARHERGAPGAAAELADLARHFTPVPTTIRRCGEAWRRPSSASRRATRPARGRSPKS
jgi:hypothetical protein